MVAPREPSREPGPLHRAPLWPRTGDASFAAPTHGEPPMARIVALYDTPKDPAAFDKYYETTHVKIAQKIPGLRSIELSKGPVITPAGPSSYHRVGTLRFD